MLASIGENISNLPFGEMKLVNELMSFDGMPMLLHFTNERGDDILAYWVDYDKETIRWIYAKVTKDELFGYLKGIRSLERLFKEITSEYAFILDLTPQKEIKQIKLISSSLIPDQYFAGELSFYPDGLSEFYLNYLRDFEYNYLVKERSYIFKAEPSNKTHGNFLTAKEGVFLLNSVIDSVEGYINVVATHKYEQKFTNRSRINNVVKSLTNHLSPVISEAGIGSFEVWLAMDTISLNEVDEIGSEIRSEIIEGYKNDVLDIDFTSSEDAKIICDKFNPIQRKKIYEPILDILENEKIDLTISDKRKTIRQIGKPIKTNTRFTDLVIPKPSADEVKAQQEINKKIYTLFVSLEEGADISKIGKKELLSNLLLFNESIEIPYPIAFPVILPNGIELMLKKPIISNVKIIDQNKLELENLEFNIDIVAKDKNDMIEKFKAAFMNFIIKAIGRKELMDVKTKELINEYIDFKYL